MTPIVAESMAEERIKTGRVIRIKGQEYHVSVEGRELRCTLRGRFRIGPDPSGVLPVVGDIVDIRPGGARGGAVETGMITAIHERRSIFARIDPGARRRYRILGSNLDRVLLVFSTRDPELNTRLLDRMIVASERGGMEAVICINKSDLVEDPSEVEGALAVYRELGYTVITCSARTNAGIDRFREAITGVTSIMAGPSGTGKTSMLGAVQPGLELRIGRVSVRTGKGRHTTTHFELHPLDGGGYLGDTPGIREFGIWDVAKEDLARYFREMVPLQGGCRFTACTHSHEPDCSVKEAVGGGTVTKERYDSYLRILDSLPDRADRKRREG